jgi:hypothetical protein
MKNKVTEVRKEMKAAMIKDNENSVINNNSFFIVYMLVGGEICD